MRQLRITLALVALLGLVQQARAATVQCWVSMYPGGPPVSWVNRSYPLITKDTLYWMNATINPSSQAKFVLKFPESTFDTWKHVVKFDNPPTTLSVPLLPTVSIQAPFTFKVKDDFGTCLATIDVAEFTFFSGDTPVAIPDSSTVQSQINVNGVGTIQRVRVLFWIQHTFAADLDIKLIGPDATAVDLTSDNGSFLDNYGTGCYEQTVFDDESPFPVTGATAPFVGMYQPEQPLSTFAGKSGGGANGTWTLEVTDDTGGDTGQLMGWTLIIDQL